MERARIVEAMEELAHRRDRGEAAHVIIVEVAEQFDLPRKALLARAEQSWGAPLESDRERNASHFEFVDKKPEIEQRVKIATQKIWDVVAPAYSQRAARLRHCERLFCEALDRSEFEHLGHRSFAISTFQAEVERLSAAKGNAQ